ncbi:TolC family protein [Ramlibacter rhizophilus]|uniref:TolC family protein n=1 Tax=Ramlibacter rhizophilus TaxID=1781167 RepID=A0A4Z0C0E5_9BURK|nr:TolC family protein [Ramlibacter rhizophilus]TFZ05003.1 TolC family protein [Ramlibacter rhizophilus]
MAFIPWRLGATAGAAMLLAGCATVDIDRTLADTGRLTAEVTQGAPLALARTDAQRDERDRLASGLLAQPLGPAEAVQLALATSPAFQALLAQAWDAEARAARGGRIANPVFSFERFRIADELEISRMLSFGLLDLLTLPQRHALAQGRMALARAELASSVVEHVSGVRQAWVRAVAAREVLGYARQVQESAEAAAELARRMQQAGNFNRLERARQQAFYADAAARLAIASHAATAAREELVRRLGLTPAQASALKLPERLPDVPASPRPVQSLTEQAMTQRLDVQLARLQLAQAGRAQGLDLLGALFDTELGLRRETVFDNADGTRSTGRGFELSLRVPLFDWGGPLRASMNAQSLAAANGYEAVVRSAASQLREAYSGYRTAWDLARHYREEVVPLRRTISEENLLRYNGMLIGVFELLADQREQVAAVQAAIEAQQQFWLADAALSASLVGRPLGASPITSSAAPAEAAAGGGH